MENNLIESKLIDNSWLYSMANRYKHQTGLPVNIWIDESGAYENTGHWKRIKFQINHRNKIRRQPNASIDLDGNVIWDTYDKTVSEISSQDIKNVSNFVRNNSYALDKVADEDILIEDFDKVMIRGGKPATKEEVVRQHELVDEFVKMRKDLI